MKFFGEKIFMLSNHVVPAVKFTSCSQYMFTELDSVRIRAAFWLGGRWETPFVFNNSSGCTWGFYSVLLVPKSNGQH